MQTWVFLHSVGIQRDHRDVGQPRLVQRPADEGNIVAGSAASAGLGHDDAQLVGVVFAGEHRLHDLPYPGDGGEAGVVVHIFQPHIDGIVVVVVQHHHIEAVISQHRGKDIEVDVGSIRRSGS